MGQDTDMHRCGSVDRDPVGAALPLTHDTSGDGRGVAPRRFVTVHPSSNLQSIPFPFLIPFSNSFLLPLKLVKLSQMGANLRLRR